MRKKLIPIAAGVLLSAAYVSSYFATLTTFPFATVTSVFVRYDRKPLYRNAVTRLSYGPLLWLDQRVRPQYWSWVKVTYRACPEPPSQPGGSGGRMAG